MKRTSRLGLEYKEQFTSDREEKNMSQRRFKLTRQNKQSSSPSGSPKKEPKKRFNPQRQGRPLICQCDVFGPNANCRCNDDLEAIEEEQEYEMMMGEGSRHASLHSRTSANESAARLIPQDHRTRSFGMASPSEKRPPESGMSSKKPRQLPCNTCHCCIQCEEDDACKEFFEVLESTMEVALKKSLDGMLDRYFTRLVGKIDNLTNVIGQHECFLKEMYSDLNDKISIYGERNAQQFQYLCMRMEHDRLFYQQQQEFFYKTSQRRTPTYEGNIDCDDLRKPQEQKGSEKPKTQGGPEVTNRPDTEAVPEEVEEATGEQQPSIKER